MDYSFDAEGLPTTSGTLSSGSSTPAQADSGTQQVVTAGEVVTVTPADTAEQIDLFVERGRVRIRTDGETPTATTGEPLLAGGWRSWYATTLKILAVDVDATITTISR